jgi:hypothetical protein
MSAMALDVSPVRPSVPLDEGGWFAPPDFSGVAILFCNFLLSIGCCFQRRLADAHYLFPPSLFLAKT